MIIQTEQEKEWFNEINDRVGLSNLCGCQLIHLGNEIAILAGSQKERLLSLIYLESLLQGMVHSYDGFNHGRYLELISRRSVTICYHDGPVQFKLLLRMPGIHKNYSSEVLIEAVKKESMERLPCWKSRYLQEIGQGSFQRLCNGMSNDPDFRDIFDEFSYLKEPLETTFNT